MQDDNVLLMDRFPRHDEIVQLPCLPLPLATPAPLAPSNGPAAASAAQEVAAGADDAHEAAGEAAERQTAARQASSQQQGLQQQPPSLLAAQRMRVAPVNS
jgi:hypothetical protein